MHGIGRDFYKITHVKVLLFVMSDLPRFHDGYFWE